MYKRLKLFGRRLLGLSAQERTGSTQNVFPTQEPAKVRKGRRALPSWMRTAKVDNSQNLRQPDRNLATTDIAQLSRTGGTREVLRELGHASPNLSAAIAAHLRTAITRRYTATAKNIDGTFNREATSAINQLLARMDALPDFSEGFARPNTLRSNSESLGKELALYGSMCAELVLDDALLPSRIQPISTTSIEWRPKGDRLIPVQVVGGDEFILDEATFFYSSLDQELMEAYSSSPFESAIKPTFFTEKLMADITRVIHRALHPRVEVTLDEESIRKYAPPEALHDPDKLEEYIESVITSVENAVNNLNPEDALVHFDNIVVKMLNNGNISLSRELETLENMGDSMLSTGTKTPPTVLGHHKSSSNVSSTEALLFLKQVEGSLQFKLNEMYSRILTLAVRLVGFDCYVEFKYEPINLRPDMELEAFRAQKQSRVLELLSLGLMTDEQASLELTGDLPPEDYTPLSGTFFKSQNPSDENPYNGEENNGSTLNQDLEPDTPTGVRGGNRKRNPQKE